MLGVVHFGIVLLIFPVTFVVVVIVDESLGLTAAATAAQDPAGISTALQKRF